MAEETLVFTGDAIRKFRLIALKHAMKLELDTGMRATSRMNVWQIVRKEFGIPDRNRQVVYTKFLEYLKTQGID